MPAQVTSSIAPSIIPDHRLANAIGALAMDAVEAARCGHPGMPMGMALAERLMVAAFNRPGHASTSAPTTTRARPSWA